MEAKVETTEKVGEEIKKVKFEDFNPADAVKFLPEWVFGETGHTSYSREKPQGEFVQEGWTFKKTIDGKEWHLTVYAKRRDMKRVSLSSPNLDENISIGGVDKVEFNYLNGQMSFLSQNGAYHISHEGTVHFLESSDLKLSSTIKLGRPQ